MSNILIKNAKIVSSKDINLCDVLISDGSIKQIGKNIKIKTEKTIDAKGKYLIPGIIDTHVHFREPGQTHKEDIMSGSRAAVSGGVTTVCDMPNNIPPTTTQEALDKKKEIAEKNSYCNMGFYIGVTKENMKKLNNIEGNIAVKMYMASSTGNLLLDEEKEQGKVIKSTDKLICVHAEDEKMIKEAKEFYKDENSTEVHSCIRHNKCSAKAVEKVIELSKKYDKHIHICHISTKEELNLIKQAKLAGIKITCEVTPHHLFMNYDYCNSMGNFVKVNPPLRSEVDCKALWQGILDGSIDVISTDHAPHTKEEKEKDYNVAPSGVPGIETSLSLMLLEVNSGEIGIKKIVEIMCENPAKIFGIKNKGEIKEEFDADLVLLDMGKRKELKWGKLYSKCNWTPYKNWDLNGMPSMTFVKGQIVFDEGEFFKPKNIDII